MSNAEDLLGLRPPIEVVELPEHGLKFNVRGLTSRERDDYEQSLLEPAPDGNRRVKANQENFRANLVARTLVDDDGKRLFTDRDIPKVGEIDARVIEVLWRAARRLSGLGDEAEEAAVESFDSAQDEGNASA